MKGKIVLVPFPFTDLSQTKLRPALVLVERESDCVVAFVSSKVPEELEATDVVVSDEDAEFPSTGLKTTSVIRLDKVATLSKSMILGEIGEVGEQLKKDINSKLRESYQL